MIEKIATNLVDALNSAGHVAKYNASFRGLEVDGIGFRCTESGSDQLLLQSELDHCCTVSLAMMGAAVRFIEWESGNIQRMRLWKEDGARVKQAASGLRDTANKQLVFADGDTLQMSIKLYQLSGPEGALRIIEAISKELVR